MPGADPVAVIGMGAVGTLPAGTLAAAGHPILACGRAPLASVTVTTDAGSTSYPVTWTDEPGDLDGVRWAVLATNIHDTAATAGWLDALGPGQCLLAVQNGVGHRERLAPLTRAAVVPVLVYVNAERTGRGCVPRPRHRPRAGPAGGPARALRGGPVLRQRAGRRDGGGFPRRGLGETAQQRHRQPADRADRAPPRCCANRRSPRWQWTCSGRRLRSPAPRAPASAG